jgi:hypothetical protein
MPDGGLTNAVKMVFSAQERNFLAPPVYFQCDRFQGIRTARPARAGRRGTAVFAG